MKTQYTPRVWHIGEEPLDPTKIEIFQELPDDDNGDNIFVAFVNGGDYGPRGGMEEAKANARLIAAAPELLAAALAILAKESEMTTCHAYMEFRELETAIAKATGWRLPKTK